MEELWLQVKQRSSFYQNRMQHYLHLRDGQELGVLARKKILLDISLQYTCDLLAILRNRCVSLLQKIFLSLSFCSYLQRICRRNVEDMKVLEVPPEDGTFLHRVTRFPFVSRTSSTRLPSHALSRDCIRLWNVGLVNINRRGRLQPRNCSSYRSKIEVK